LRTRDQGGDHLTEQVIGANAAEPATVPPEWGANSVDNECCAGHRADHSRKLAKRVLAAYRRAMIHDFHTLAEHDVSWLAIRQPAVMRMLEAELASPDGDAFAAGLELACRVLGGRTPLGDLRLDHRALATGMAAVRSGRCDRTMVRSIRDQIDELPIALTALEEDAVATVIAGIIWAVLDASVRDLDDAL